MEIEDVVVIATEANADAGGKQINRRLREVSRKIDRVKVFSNLGQLGYLSVLRESDVVIGNSSSGIVEAPSVKTATLNVGNRQDGRLKAPSIIDVDGSLASIRSALSFTFSIEMERVMRSLTSPFGIAGATSKISKILSTFELRGLLVKKFHDIPGMGLTK
jgi:UDP-N-acetylglucosamine 2-epimerase